MIDWYRIKSALIDEPEIRKMARILGIDRWGVVGRVQAFWGWCDIHASEGHSGLAGEDVDEMFGCEGFADAMVAVGWLSKDESGEMYMSNWEKYNSPAAKERARKTQEKRAFRARVKANCEVAPVVSPDDGDNMETCVSEVSPNCLPNININSNINNNNVRVGIATLHREPAAEASPAQPTHAPSVIPEEAKPLYAAWLAAVCGAHPSVRRSKTLAKDVEAAAVDAFIRCPDAMMQAALLRAYFADKRTKEDRNGEKFWRTNRQLDYFNHIEEILEHAERWDRETRWSKRAQNARRSDKNAPSCPRNDEAGQPATHEEMQAMLDDMKAELGLKGGKP